MLAPGCLLTDCTLHLNALTTSAALAGQDTPPEQGLLNGGSHYDYYRCRDGRWLSVGSLEPAFLSALCSAIGQPDLATEFNRNPSEAKAKLASRLAEETQAYWRGIFSKIDVCVEPVLSLPEALDSALARQRGWVVAVPHGQTKINQPAMPIRFSRAEATYGQAGGAIGKDTKAILREAGLAESTIDSLQASGALG